jgi:cation diffusion facilitator CzcD-associated flavoprotein CzcO
MTIEWIETAIIGAGQAGLATAYHLQRRGRQCVILDGNQRVGDNWRTNWDSLRLNTPAGYNGLPGLPFPAPKWFYPTKDEVADYLAAYAERFATIRWATGPRRWPSARCDQCGLVHRLPPGVRLDRPTDSGGRRLAA